MTTEQNMKSIPRTALISLGLLTICGMPIPGANAQSLTSAPIPSAEIKSLTKALEGEWSLNVRFEPNSSAALAVRDV